MSLRKAQMLLKDVCSDWKNDIVSGPFGSNLKREHFRNKGTPVLKIQNVKPFRICPEKMDYVTQRKAEELSRHSFKKGDIIVTKLGLPLGAAAIVQDIETGIIVADLVRIRVPEEYKRFLCYQINSPRACHHLNSMSEGATRPRVKLGALRELPIFFPPLPEQKRIVEILDETFEAIDKAITNTERNIRNAEELLSSFVDNRYQNFNSIKQIPLEQLCLPGEKITYGVIKLGKEFQDGIPCLRTSNVRWMSIDQGIVKRIDPDLSSSYSRTILKGGEVLVNVRGTLGGVAVVPKSMQGWNVSREIAVVPINWRIADPSFVACCIASSSSQAVLTGMVKGVAYKGINLTDLRKLPIPIPTIEEQSSVSYAIEQAKQNCDALLHIYLDKVGRSQKLKQSILQKAFTGELTKDFRAVDKAFSEAGA